MHSYRLPDQTGCRWCANRYACTARRYTRIYQQTRYAHFSPFIPNPIVEYRATLTEAGVKAEIVTLDGTIHGFLGTPG